MQTTPTTADIELLKQFQQFQKFQQLQNQQQRGSDHPRRQQDRPPKTEAPTRRETPVLTFTQLCDAMYKHNKNTYLERFPGKFRDAVLFAKFCDHHGYFVKRQMFDDRLKEFQAEVPATTDATADDHEPTTEA